MVSMMAAPWGRARAWAFGLNPRGSGQDRGPGRFSPLALANRKLRHDRGMCGTGRADVPGVTDEFVAERFVMAVDGPAAAVMEDAPPAIRGQRAVEDDKRPLRQQRIAGVLFCPDNEIERYFVVLGV